MLRDLHGDFLTAPWLSKPTVCCSDGVQKRPPRACLECGKPLPEIRAWNQVACRGACQDARKAKTHKKALNKLNRKRRAQTDQVKRFFG